MAIHACVARAVLLTGAVLLGGAVSGWAQAAVEAGAVGAASSTVGSAAGKATGKSVGSALGALGGKMDTATAKAAPAAPTTTTMVLPANVPAGAPGIITVAGPQPDIHFDVVSFQKCAGGVSSSKVDLPADGDSVVYHCQPVSRMLSFAYAGGEDFKLSGIPLWAETDLYMMEAKVAPEDVAAWQNMGLSARKLAVRKLLTDRLKLKIKVNTTPKPVYTLQVAESGPKLKEYADGEQQKLPNGLMLNGKDMTWVGRIAYFQDTSMSGLTELLSAHLDRPVVNQTGLEGGYNFSLPLPHGSGTTADANMTENMPSVAEALAELGLKLEAAKTAVDGLMVENIERPTPD